MKNVYLSILDLIVKAFKNHCKKTVTLVFPRCGKVFVSHTPFPALCRHQNTHVTVTFLRSGFDLLRVLKNKGEFLSFLSFFERFFFRFLVRELVMLALQTCCQTHRVDAGNRLPLCEGEVEAICQVPNLINYQFQTLHYH